MNAYRIIDANINRVSEGIRVLEDISRFIFENKAITEELRNLRHLTRKSFKDERLINFRDSIGDIGFEISSNSVLDKKEYLDNLIDANFKRVQEGLRCIEESLKILGHYEISKVYENIRYSSYNLEKKFVIKDFSLDTDLYCITGEDFSLGRDNITVAQLLIDAGIKVIQYREKNKTKSEKLKECIEIKSLTAKAGVTFIINDDVDIALAVKAEGIHIGQDDMPIGEVRKIVGKMIIGVSTHNPEQAIKAVKDGADYIGVGPVFETKTKKNVEKSDGLNYLKWVSENINIPHVAIGGITEDNIILVKSNGGKCFAMISDIVGTENIKNKVNSIRLKLYNGEMN